MIRRFLAVFLSLVLPCAGMAANVVGPKGPVAPGTPILVGTVLPPVVPSLNVDPAGPNAGLSEIEGPQPPVPDGSAAAAPAPPPAIANEDLKSGAPERLDKVFDHAAGKLSAPGAAAPVSVPTLGPTPGEILGRAARKGISRAKIGEAVARSKDLPEAAAELVSTFSLLSLDEMAAAMGEFGLKWLIEQIWFDVAMETALWPEETHWPVPAAVVEKDGVTFYLHGISHGFNSSRVESLRIARKLVRTLEAEGRPLYSEQNLPFAYGYAYGRETLDHSVRRGFSAKLRAPSQRNASLYRVMRALDLSLLALFAAPLFYDSYLRLATLLVAVGLNAHWWGHRYLRFAKFKALFLIERIRHGKALYERHLAPIEKLIRTELLLSSGRAVRLSRKIELPMPLFKAAATGKHAQEVLNRSESMALAMYEDALRRGFKAVHMLCGYGHVDQIAWFLRNRPAPKSDLPVDLPPSS